MGTTQTTLAFLLDQLHGLPAITTRKMFGEYGLYCAGKPVGLVCDDQLYLKITPAGRRAAPNAPEGLPYPGAKPYLLITADNWENRDWLTGLIQATESDLPPPKPRKKKP